MTSPKDENRFFSINHQAVELIAFWAIKKEKIYSQQRTKNICEMYALLKKIWEKGNPPFCLKGKSGKWKKITQSWLAEKSTCSIKTIERRLRDLQDIGLIKYERHGYISHKYVQFLYLTNISKDDLTDKSLSVTYQTNCPSSKRKIVLPAKDKLSEPNIRREEKGKKEVFIDKKYKVKKEIISHIKLIEEFWTNKSKIKTQEVWKWQVNELIKLKTRYGDTILESQLRESINKGWNSIEVSKYEKFNNIENNAAEYPKRAEKILENMKTHARMLGEDSSYYNDPKYGEEYKNILNEQ